jgi:3-hydroxyacyl-CoA dehydrogenase
MQTQRECISKVEEENSMVRCEREDRVAAIVIDSPPVNALCTAVSEGIAVALEQARTDPDVHDRAAWRGPDFCRRREVDDMAGLDVAWRVRQELGHFREPGIRRPVAVDRLFALGRYGQKTGKGWYRYDEDRKPVPDTEVLELIRTESRKVGISQRQFSDEEIVERSFLGMINEGARALKEGRALRASDIDVINGYGFPRGGPMFYADYLGLPQVVARLSQFERELGPRWAVAPLLRELAESGKSYREFDKSRRV